MNKIKAILIVSLLPFCLLQAQEKDEKALKEAKSALRESKNITYEANENLVQNDFVSAEAEYRKAISKSSENAVAPYNLGRAYYNRENFSEAFGNFKQAGEKATSKDDKHKAFHNMGNVFMQSKEYQKAVDGYKEALRANPTDEETRYNLALAKELLKKQQDQQKKDDKKDDQNKDDQKDDEEKNKDQDKGEDDKDNEGDQKDDENKDDGDEGKDKSDENKKGEGDENKEEKPQPNKGDKEEEKKKPRPNQLSKQQVQNLLEAMQNEEKKVQQKIDAKKVKGAKIKNEKDW